MRTATSFAPVAWAMVMTSAMFMRKTVRVRPEGKVTDAGALIGPTVRHDVAHAHGVPLIVDNTVPSPFLCNPLRLGADLNGPLVPPGGSDHRLGFTFLAAPGFPRRIRPEALAQYLSMSFVPGAGTMLEGVHELRLLRGWAHSLSRTHRASSASEATAIATSTSSRVKPRSWIIGRPATG